MCQKQVQTQPRPREGDIIRAEKEKASHRSPPSARSLLLRTQIKSIKNTAPSPSHPTHVAIRTHSSHGIRQQRGQDGERAGARAGSGTGHRFRLSAQASGRPPATGRIRMRGPARPGSRTFSRKGCRPVPAMRNSVRRRCHVELTVPALLTDRFERPDIPCPVL